MTLQTEFGFTLPKGYVDEHGGLHRKGTMRLATARDEIQPLRDPRVKENEAYLTIILLARVITALGEIDQVTPKTVEGLFAADLAYLQDVYAAVNFGSDADIERAIASSQQSAGLVAAAPREQPRPPAPTFGALTRQGPAPLAVAPSAPPDAADGADDTTADDGPDVDEDGIELPSTSRRARIEEVGRSTVRPDGAR